MRVSNPSLTIEDDSIPCEKHRYYVSYNFHENSVLIQHAMNYTKHKENLPPETYKDIDVSDAEDMELEDLLEFMKDFMDIQDWMYAGVGDIPKDQLMVTRVSDLHTLGSLSIYVI